MTYEQIIKKITKGLTGNTSKDIKYLQEQMEYYKDHSMSQEILRACGRIMYDLFPEDKKSEIGRIIGYDLKVIEATLDEIRYNIYKKDISKAMNLSEALMKKAEEEILFQNDNESEYFTFNEFFEEALYIYHNKPKRKIRAATIPFSSIYFQHGNLLFEQKKYEEARLVLEKAMRWNPINSDILFEHMETFKVTGDIEKFAELTRKAFQYVFKPKDIARCYRNMGYYFIEKKKYKVATACYFMSLEFEKENKAAQSELYYIHTKTSKEFCEPTFDEIKMYGEKYDFPIGGSDDVIGLALSYGEHFLDDGQVEGAIYCLEIVYNLTHNDKIKNLIEELK